MPLNGFLASMDFPLSLEAVGAMVQLFFLAYRSAESLVLSTKNCSPSKERPLPNISLSFLEYPAANVQELQNIPSKSDGMIKT